ncbi:hypothetical protein BJ912DRAFT_945437, partial [Pholiota molesta]
MALKSCALVCRAFLPLCRKHLFKQMCIHNQHDHRIMKNLAALLRTTPEISTYVRDLNVHLYGVRPLPMDLTIFSRLESFRLAFSPEPGDFRTYHLDFNKMEQQMKSTLLYPIPTLEAFGLNHIANFPFYDLPLLYPNLRELAVSGMKMDEIGIPAGASPLPPIKLDTFSLQQSNGQPIIDFSDLKELFVFYLRKINIAAVLGFRLNGLGHLKEICIHITYMYLDSDPLSGLCEELEIFGAHPNVLEQLMIAVTPKDFERLAGDEWKKLDQVIDRFAWPKLKKVGLASDTDLIKRFLTLPEIHSPNWPQ